MIEISHADGSPDIPLGDDVVSDIANYVLESVGNAGKSVSITFVSSDFIRCLNRDYRGKDAPTDVLSFCFSDENSDSECSGSGMSFPGDNDLGEIYISPDQVMSNARDAGEDAAKEFLRVIAHGMLHLSGFDHEEGADVNDVIFALASGNAEFSGDDASAQEMLVLQERLLAGFLKRS